MNRPSLHQSRIWTVLDIGANTGQFSRTIPALLPEATIYTFEPQGDCFTEIQRSFAASSTLDAIRTAVRDEDEEITFLVQGFLTVIVRARIDKSP